MSVSETFEVILRVGWIPMVLRHCGRSESHTYYEYIRIDTVTVRETARCSITGGDGIKLNQMACGWKRGIRLRAKETKIGSSAG